MGLGGGNIFYWICSFDISSDSAKLESDVLVMRPTPVRKTSDSTPAESDDLCSKQ